MAIQNEIWASDIAENVYADNSFLSQARDDSAMMRGKTVHLPQSGAKPNVEVNRTQLPAAAAKRPDTTANYDVDEHTTDPVLLQDTEEVEASYPKRQSLLFDHMESLKESVANTALYNWAPTAAANIIRTTGDARAAYKSFQAGNRKMVTSNDFIEAGRLMDRMDIPQQGRCALVDSDLKADLLKIPEFVQMQIIGQANLVEGAFGKLLGFTIYIRSKSTMFTGAGVKKSAAAVATGTDCASIQFWHPSYVRVAKGNIQNGGVKVFSLPGDPGYYGDVFSALVRTGSRIARLDERGVVALVEAAAA